MSSIMDHSVNKVTEAIIGAAIEVHRTLGPGLLESTYSECLCRELSERGVTYERARPLPVVYKGEQVEFGYLLDLVVDGSVVVQVKAVETITAVHEAELLTYLRLGGWHVGLLINFNVKLLKQGIRRKEI